MTSLSPRPEVPREAGPARRVLHTLMALAGWALFLYWWWLVFQRVSPREVRFTVVFVAVSIVVCVLVTAAWAWHNLRIFKRKGPRALLREKTPDYSHDTLGRTVRFQDVPDRCRTAPVVIVRVRNGLKSYEAAKQVPTHEQATADPASAAPAA